MTITLNPFNFCKRYLGDTEQMIEDIDRVEETPATRYNRKVEANLRYGPLSGHLYPLQREIINALSADGEVFLRAKPLRPSPFAVNADMGIPYDPAESMARPRDQQFARFVRSGEIPATARVVVISGAGQYGKTAAAVQAAMDLECESFGVIEAKTAKLAADIKRDFEVKLFDTINFIEPPSSEQLVSHQEFSRMLTERMAKIMAVDFDSIYRNEAETPKPGRRLAPAEIAEKHKRTRAPRKGKR